MGVEHTRPLDRLRREDEGLFGGKSASLGELIAGDIPVPPGFGLSAGAFEAFLDEADLAPRIAQALSGRDPEDLEALRAASAAIVEAVRAAPVPDVVRAEIERRYA